MAPCCSPCLLLLPDPGDIFQLSSSRWFLCSLGPFSGSAWFIGVWLSQGRCTERGQGHGAVPPLVTHQPDGHQHPPGTTSWGGCRHFVPPALLQGGAVAELLEQLPAGELRLGTKAPQLLFWVLQAGSQASCPLLLPKFVKVSGFQPGGGHWVMHWKMLNQALCPLAKPWFMAGVPTPARISSNSLWALIYWELEKHR